MRLGLAAATFVLLGGCGYVGPALPPALYIPEPISDLRVEEIGDKIIVRFTPPAKTTEDIPVTDLRAITLYVGEGEAEFSRDRWAATAERYDIAVTESEFELPAKPEWNGKQLVFAIRTTGRSGRESDWSTKYGYLAAGTPLEKPESVVPSNVPEAVALKWTGNAPRYRVLRATLSDPMPKLAPVAEVDATEYVDLTIAEGARYQYVIVGIEGENRQSLPSEPVEIAPMDTFAPAVPAGLTAVVGAGSVNLSWTRSPESDLEGYKIFRAVADGPFEVLAARVALPAYTDTQVAAGMRYRYKILAFDRTGNESEPSIEASAQVE